MNAVLYIHGKSGNAAEADHYKVLFPRCDVIGIAYKGETPWEAGAEINRAFTGLNTVYDRIILIANSVGAYFLMNASAEKHIAHAYFISPIVDMEKLIIDMMKWACVTEQELQDRKIIHTDYGEDLSWEYLCYVREHPVSWDTPTDILYGSKDHLTSIETMTSFAGKHQATLTVMENGEHWFHTDAQMLFLDNWIKEKAGSLGT